MPSFYLILSQTLSAFLHRSPALLWGLLVFSLFLLSLNFSLAALVTFLAFILIILLGAEKKIQTLFLIFLLSFVVIAYSHLRYQLPKKTSVLKIDGSFHIEKIISSSRKQNHFSYYGTFTSSSKDLRFPVLARFKKDLLPTLHAKYSVQGKLTSNNKPYFSAFFESAILEKTYPSKKLYEAIFSLRTHLKSVIDHYVSNNVAADFLSAITLGQNTNKKLKEHMMHKGLLHVLAISGFHFSILSAFIIGLFSFFFSLRTASIFSLCLMSFYFIVVGPMPSVLRAWFCFSFWIISKLFSKPSCPLNTLGLSLIFVCVFDPLFVFHIGMHLSFAITGALLLFSSPLSHFFKNHLTLFSFNPISSLNTFQMMFLNRVAFFLGSSLSVHLVAMPLLLFYFHTFNFNGLVFNILLPFLMSLCSILTIIGILTHFLLPSLAHYLFKGIELYTDWIIRFSTETTYRINFPFYSSKIDSLTLVMILLTILTTGYYFYRSHKASQSSFPAF